MRDRSCKVERGIWAIGMCTLLQQGDKMNKAVDASSAASERCGVDL